jgi:hypothetical protein
MIPFYEFLRQQQKLLFSLTALYLTLLLLQRVPFASPHIWLIAAAFSVFMNLCYMSETCGRRACLGPQSLIASVLIASAVLGVVMSPAFVVFAIFAQGVWHLTLRLQVGRRLLSLNTLGCFAVDMTYSAVLLALYLR